MNLRSTNVVRGAWLLFALVFTACGGTGPASESSEEPAVADVSAYFIMTQVDPRLCPSPTCGGYFVAAVNLRTTRCADGTLASQCHAGTLDLAPSGLPPEDAARFEKTYFAQKHGLVRGQLVRRELAPGVVGDVLVATEAWAGQALSTPTGAFSRLTSTGIVCVTYPCPSYQGERLNVGLITRYNSVDLYASGAPADAVKKGYEALQTKGILAAGVDVPISGPAGTGLNFKASEFYLRFVASPSPCRAQDAVGIGACTMFLGYAWNGTACVGLSGCSCQGADCGSLYSTPDACKTAHAQCPPPPVGCGPRGTTCAANQYCDFPDNLCGAGQLGTCKTRPDVCTMIYAPACGCNGVTYSSDCVAAGSGFDVAHEGACP